MNMYYRKSAARVFILCQEASKQPVSSLVTGEHREKHLCTNLGLKRREGICSKETYFWEITVHTWLVCGIHEQSTHHISLNKKDRPRCYANSHPLNRTRFGQNCMLDYGTNCDLLCIRQCATCGIHVVTLLCDNSTTAFSSNTTSSSFVPSASSLWSHTICSNGGRRPGVSYHVWTFSLLFCTLQVIKTWGGEGLGMRLTTIHAIQ